MLDQHTIPLTQHGARDRRYGPHPHPGRLIGAHGTWQIVLASAARLRVRSFTGRLLSQFLVIREAATLRTLIVGRGEAVEYFRIPRVEVQEAFRTVVIIE